MIDQLISLAQRMVGNTRIGEWAGRRGLAQWLRIRKYRRMIDAGVYNAILLDEPLRFMVTAQMELVRIDAFWRERELAERILEAVQPGEQVWDIGANIGVLSTLLAKRLGPAGVVVHAFEPEPRNAERLRANREANRLANLVVHETAVGATDGETTLYVTGDAGAGSHTTVMGRGRELVVAMTTGSTIQSRHGDPGVVKIDVEGSELDVIRGMMDILERRVVHDLFIEVHPELLCSSGHDPEELAASISRYGYERIWTSGRGSERHEHYRRTTCRAARP